MLTCYLLLLYICLPGTLDTIFYRLIGRTETGIGGQGALCFVPQSLGGFECVFYADARDFEHTVHIFNIALDIGCQVFGRFYSARIQRAGKGAGQSPGNARHQQDNEQWHLLILEELVAELPAFRRPLGPLAPPLEGSAARRMREAQLSFEQACEMTGCGRTCTACLPDLRSHVYRAR